MYATCQSDRGNFSNNVPSSHVGQVTTKSIISMINCCETGKRKSGLKIVHIMATMRVTAECLPDIGYYLIVEILYEDNFI